MATSMVMPQMGYDMHEGKVVRWLKQEGEEVIRGEIIAEIETDKATMEVEAVDEGTLAKILIPEGTEGVKVNAVIAVLSEDGEDASSATASAAPPIETEAKVTPVAEPEVLEAQAAAEKVPPLWPQ